MLLPGGFQQRIRGIASPRGSAVLDWSDPINAGCVGDWLFGRGASYDLTGHYPPVVAAQSVPTPAGPAAYFGGVGVLAAGLGSVVKTNRISAAVWFVPGVTTRGDVFTCWNTGGSNADQFNLLYGLSGAVPQFFISSSSATSGSGNGATAMVVGILNAELGTYNGSTVAVYLNGVLGASAAASITLGTGTTSVRFGNNGNNDGAFSGNLVRAKLWNRALSAYEARQITNRDPWVGLKFPSDFAANLWKLPSGPAPITGTLAATDPTDTANLTGTVAWPVITGTLAATEAPDTSAMSGTVAFSAVTGTLAATDTPDISAMSGSTTWPAVSGTLAATDPTDAAAFVGAGVLLSGTLAATDVPDHAAMSGTVAWAAVTGALVATESPDAANFAGNLTALPVAPPTTLTRELIMSTLFSKITAPPMVFNFSADTSAGFVGLANVSDMSGLMAGMPVSGDGIPEHASLATITPDVTISLPATASVTASAITQGFQTYSRRLAQFREEADMPALYLLDIGEEHLPRQSNEPGQIVFSSEIWIFTDAGEDPDAVPASALNFLLDAVQTAIDPPYDNPGGLRQNLGLYGIIYARIEGEVMKDPGHNGRIAGAIIPIKIRVGQSALNRTIPVIGGMEDANAQYRLSAGNWRVA